jgi:hypothetical protein
VGQTGFRLKVAEIMVDCAGHTLEIVLQAFWVKAKSLAKPKTGCCLNICFITLSFIGQLQPVVLLPPRWVCSNTFCHCKPEPYQSSIPKKAGSDTLCQVKPEP